MSAVTISPGALAFAYEAAIARLIATRFLDETWARQTTPWARDAATAATIANRLGWLGALDFVTPELPRLQALAESVRGDGVTDIVLLGMGGSSLAPEVLRQIVGVAEGYPRFRMLDSVDPASVSDAMARAESSLFIVASKSGSTIEPTVMALEAQRRLIAAGHAAWGRRVIAITDEGSALHQQARREGFRDIFINPSDIGGRYSALSYFGLVPAALMGANVTAIVREAKAMEIACRAGDPATNPALALGAFMGAAWAAGRDKLLLCFPRPLQSLGLWIEQLVAESTGKQGKGIVPISTAASPAVVGRDAAVVVMHDGAHSAPSAWGTETPVAAWRFESSTQIGAEFFRWEMATAVAGALMEVNPFDEPNVQQAKDATRVLLQHYEQQKRLPAPAIHATVDGARLTLSAAAQERLGGASPRAFLDLVDEGDYFGLLAFVPSEDPHLAAVLERFRDEVAARTGCVTSLGYGPRYLHSTGQLHKGGRNNGVFVVIAAEAAEDLPIPGMPFTFGVLETAQALGDFESLDRTGRRALLLQVPQGDSQTIGRALDLLLTRTRA